MNCHNQLELGLWIRYRQTDKQRKKELSYSLKVPISRSGNFENVQKHYEKEKGNNISKAETSHIKMVKDLEITELVFCTKKQSAFIALKDQKENLSTKTSGRVIQFNQR